MRRPKNVDKWHLEMLYIFNYAWLSKMKSKLTVIIHCKKIICNYNSQSKYSNTFLFNFWFRACQNLFNRKSVFGLEDGIFKVFSPERIWVEVHNYNLCVKFLDSFVVHWARSRPGDMSFLYLDQIRILLYPSFGLAVFQHLRIKYWN